MSTPSIPDPEPMPDPAPAPPPGAAPPVATPAPEMVNANGKAPQIKKPQSARSQAQQQAKGTSALKIPLNAGASSSKAKQSGGLNIPT